MSETCTPATSVEHVASRCNTMVAGLMGGCSGDGGGGGRGGGGGEASFGAGVKTIAPAIVRLPTTTSEVADRPPIIKTANRARC